MDQPSGQRSYEHQEGGSWRGGGNRNQRDYGRVRGRGGYDRGGYGQYNRGNDRQGNQWNNRNNYRQENRQYNQDQRQQRGFGRPHNYQGPNVYHQEDRAEAQSYNNFYYRARPNDKNQDDHMRDSSPDRQYRSRPKDKYDEDYTRDPSQDRSLPEHCIQETPSSSADDTTQNQSQQVIRANQGHIINASADLSLDILTKEEREALLNKKMEETRKKNDVLRKRYQLLQVAKVEKEKDVKSTMFIEEEEFPNSSDFVYDLEDSTNSSFAVREDSLGQRFEFDQTVKVSKVPIGGANLVWEGKGKKKKNKGDRKREKGTETQKEKDKTEIDETPVEDTEQNVMFNEKMEVEAPTGSRALNVDASGGFGGLGVNTASGSGALAKFKDDYLYTPPVSWDEEKFVDAVQEPEEEFVDVHRSDPVVIVRSSEETITIDEPENSISAIDYLMEKDVVAVHVEASEDGFRRITCVTEDKSYIFELEKNPYLVTSGKVAEFFNWTPELKGPFKVFHGLDSKMCAVFFDKYDIILDGTKIYDIKIAYDMMKEGSLGDMSKLKKTGFSPDCIPVDTENVTAVCLTYLKAYQYFSKEIQKELKDYKKQLFKMVSADICKEDLKKLRERKKREYKDTECSKSKSNKMKKMKDFSFLPLPSQSNKTEINLEKEGKLKIIPSSDSSSSHNFTVAEHLPKNCNSTINLQSGSAHPSLNNNLQQEFNETRQMARQCATQRSQEEQYQVIAVVKHESVEFPDGRRYTCRSTVVPDPVIVEEKSTATQTESDKCKDVGVQCEIIDWNKYQKMIELAEVLLK
ncbi:unnamed protein product [Mytilus coruscus]|uniref:3'-5' exonuclease domain-containing protein n=1 Tax=Mytilus coruscus TaxID=42192 RepID=A0A6J8EEA5_MYTCO|nr:unnamed protein product [Mytilus coruscus]